MTRVTVAEKRRIVAERNELEFQAAWVRFRKEYHRQLFKLMAQAKEFNVSLTFTENFVSFDFVEYREFVLPSVLPDTRDEAVLNEFDTVLREFEYLRTQRDEEQRRYEMKKAALAKLSDEERELLGI